MAEEKIIKKEGKIIYKKKGEFLNNHSGDLVLTPTELFLANKKGEKIISIQIIKIINVRLAKNAGSTDYMFITYKNSQKEETARFMHFSLFDSYLGMGELARVKQSYFSSWQQAIEDLRQGKSGKNDLSELENLASLKDKGIITEEEFKAKKKQILGI